jgi:hypothetical protein
MKIQYDFFLFFLDRLDRMHENKKNLFYFIFSFYFIIIIFFFDENQVFNTKVVSLQYKNTNRN